MDTWETVHFEIEVTEREVHLPNAMSILKMQLVCEPGKQADLLETEKVSPAIDPPSFGVLGLRSRGSSGWNSPCTISRGINRGLRVSCWRSADRRSG